MHSVAPSTVPDATYCGKCWTEDDGEILLCLHGPQFADQPRPGWYHPRTWADGIMPLWEFGREHRERIEASVALRKPPEQWLKGELAWLPSRAFYEWHWTRGLRLRRVPGYVTRSRRHIPDELRFAVYERDGFTCLHCDATENLSLDHIHPYSLGGEDALENLQTLCRSCNSRKGARV